MQKLNWKPKTEIDLAGIRVIELLQARKFQAFWVGGVVRNILLKRESNNIDITTDAIPDQIETTLNEAKIPNKPVGKEFGSILAIVEGQLIEITTFRAEGYYSDNRHPDKVEFIKDYLQDAKRRDFTVNALYFDPISKMVYDPTNGLKDLKAKILRFVGDPKKRIDEDGLRMLRGVRLATTLGFKLEKNSFAAIKTRAKYIQDISGERIKAELDKILASPNRAQGVKLLDETGLLKFIIPQFERLKQLKHDAKTFHLEGNLLVHHLKALEIMKVQDLNLAYAVLFHDVGKVIPRTKIFSKDENRMRWSFVGHIELSAKIFLEFAKKFRFSRLEQDKIHWLILHHDDRGSFRKMSDIERVKYFLNVTDPELLVELWRVDSGANLRLKKGREVWGKSDAVPMAQSTFKKIQQGSKLFALASGDLIMKYSGLKPGKELGQKIEDVKAEIVLGRIKTEQDLIKFLG